MIIQNGIRGYRSIGGITVTDYVGNEFYYFPRSVHFNLPAGRYLVVRGKAIPTVPRIYNASGKSYKGEIYTLTKGKRKNEYPSVVWKTNGYGYDIHIDVPNNFGSFTHCQQVFMVLHELGHPLGESQYDEVACDRYAAISMLRQGYNPSQISQAIEIFRDMWSKNEHIAYQVRAEKLHKLLLQA